MGMVLSSLKVAAMEEKVRQLSQQLEKSSQLATESTDLREEVKHVQSLLNDVQQERQKERETWTHDSAQNQHKLKELEDNLQVLDEQLKSKTELLATAEHERH